MHHLAMATQSTAKPARLTAETDHESTPSLDATRARRLSREHHPAALPHAR